MIITGEEKGKKHGKVNEGKPARTRRKSTKKERVIMEFTQKDRTLLNELFSI